jgi:hypothetical protein
MTLILGLFVGAGYLIYVSKFSGRNVMDMMSFKNGVTQNGTPGSNSSATGGQAQAALANQMQTAVMATSGTFALMVQSDPAGAEILVNEDAIGYVTPARITLKANTPATVKLRKDGYLVYEKTVTPRKDDVFRATLSRTFYGYLDINVVNGGINPVVYVNGRRLLEKPPLTKFPVMAGTRVTVRAENTFSGFQAEKSVTVGTDEKKQVTLMLEPPRKPAYKK